MVVNVEILISSLFTLKINQLISSLVLRYDFSQWEKSLYFIDAYIKNRLVIQREVVAYG